MALCLFLELLSCRASSARERRKMEDWRVEREGVGAGGSLQ